MRKWFTMKVEDTTAEIVIYDEIGQSWWGEPTVSAKSFLDDLKALGDVRNVALRVNSPEVAHVVTYLIEPDDPRLARQPLLRNAIAYWRQGVSVRKPRCFSCKTKFSDDAHPGAYLLATPATAPTEAAVVGLCATCWRDLSDEELKRHAARVLRPVMPKSTSGTSEP